MLILFRLVVTLSITSCQAIADIFQAGVWVGAILVLAVLAVIGFLVARGKKG